MDWYLGCTDDLVAPSNQDILGMFPSPNSWSQMDLSMSGTFDPMSKYFVTHSDYADSGQNLGLNHFEHQVDEHFINSNACQEFTEGSVDQDSRPREDSDYQLSDIHMTNQTDDIFQSSSHEISMDNCAGPFNFCDPELESDEFCAFPSDDFYKDIITDSKYDDPSHLFGMGSSKYLKTHAFSPPVGEVSSHYSSQFPKHDDNPPSLIKVQLEEVFLTPECEIMTELVNEETISKESILQDLETAIAQMSEHTRICFRDALYRLADNSRQHWMDLVSHSPPLMVHGGTYQSQNTKNMESETNAIDRAVATLMFYKRKDSSVQNFPHCHSSSSVGKEVPVFN